MVPYFAHRLVFRMPSLRFSGALFNPKAIDCVYFIAHRDRFLRWFPDPPLIATKGNIRLGGIRCVPLPHRNHRGQEPPATRAPRPAQHSREVCTVSSCISCFFDRQPISVVKIISTGATERKGIFSILDARESLTINRHLVGIRSAICTARHFRSRSSPEGTTEPCR